MYNGLSILDPYFFFVIIIILNFNNLYLTRLNLYSSTIVSLLQRIVNSGGKKCSLNQALLSTCVALPVSSDILGYLIIK